MRNHLGCPIIDFLDATIQLILPFRADVILVIKALKLGSEAKTDIVLSNADAERFRDPEANLKYLTEGRVIIVVD